MKYFFVAVFLVFCAHIFGQFTDDFSDGDFTNNPTWLGDDSVFVVVDVAGNYQLRSNKTIASTSFYLVTDNSFASDAQWEFFTYLNLNTSGTNYVDVYLTADQSNLLSSTLNGYFVRIGGTPDEVSLYRRDAGIATKIIDGVDGVTNSTNNYLKIKVTRTTGFEWKLERDATGAGNTFFTEGIVSDATFTTSAYFGVAITQSTSTFFQKHFFDDFYVGPIIYDTTPPVLLSATAISSTEVDVLFNEALDQATAEDVNNYDIQPFQSATLAILDGTNPNLVHLTLASPMSNGNTYTLFTSGIEDVEGNVSESQSVQFSYLVAEIPEPGDVIVNEFMADPTPIVGLPEVEFVEIYNRSTKVFNLNGWKLGDTAGEGTIGNAWLLPGEYKILASTTNAPLFTNSVPVTSFPSLGNAADDIYIKSNAGLLLDFLSYTDVWYNDPVKKDGGYTLERINPFLPCFNASNWTASNSSSGGTPGVINSVYNDAPDVTPPTIKQLNVFAPNVLEVHFSEGMDSTSLADAGITVVPNLTVDHRTITSAFPSFFTLQFVEDFVPGKFYTLTLEDIADCSLNSTTRSGKFVLPEIPEENDVVINELLFNPLTGGSDWVELYNNSDKVLDLKGWQIGNYSSSTGAIANIKIVPNQFILSPGQYVVLGKDSLFVLSNYPYAVPGRFVFTDLPAMNNDSGSVFLIFDNSLIDKVSYKESWHFKFVSNKKGKSLERIDPNADSNDSGNWHTAAESVGFGTPGGENSQYYPAVSSGLVSLTSQSFSPDNDGFEDILQISYEMEQSGLIGDITIYDAMGRKVKTLVKSELLGTRGTFVWDGVLDNGYKVSVGKYIVVFEAFDLNGGLSLVKKLAFVVAGNMN